ncbi:hypothetical protein GQ53DRAFT_151489 [Thozetella sp. PMI_491]|nr:hypothetical protein GQ53DRAFT_151489 [Thozetella sp. PMI_491]
MVPLSCLPTWARYLLPLIDGSRYCRRDDRCAPVCFGKTASPERAYLIDGPGLELMRGTARCHPSFPRLVVSSFWLSVPQPPPPTQTATGSRQKQAMNQWVPDKSGVEHDEEEWDEIKDLFISLYLDQEKSLAEVRRFLGQHFNFHATPRQYKVRIKKWGAYKQDKHDESRSGSQRHSSTAAAPIGTTRPRGTRLVVAHPGRFQRWARPGITGLPSLSGPLGALQRATYGTQKWYSGVVYLDNEAAMVRSQNPNWNIRQFYDVANSVSAHTSVSDWKIVQHELYPRMLDCVVPLLQDPNPIVFVCLLQVCCRFFQEGQEPVLRHFLTYLLGVTKIRSLEQHPLSLVSAACVEAGNTLMDIITTCLQQAIDIMQAKLGEDHDQTVGGYRGLLSATYANKDYAGAVKAATALIKANDAWKEAGEVGYHTLESRFDRMRANLSLGNLEGASSELEEVEARIAEIEDKEVREAWKLQAATLEVKGEVLRLRGDPAAITVLEKQVKLFKTVLPQGYPQGWWWLHIAQKQLAWTKASLAQSEPLPGWVFPS